MSYASPRCRESSLRFGLILIASALLIAGSSCSLESGLGGATCENEGERDGNRVCQNGYWVSVGDAYGAADSSDAPTNCEPKNEVCNGNDDDCDGVTDEGCGCHFQDKNAGVCTDGTRNIEGECEPPSSYSKNENVNCADGKDNDCDGKVDQADGDCVCPPGETRKCYSGPSGTADNGVCKRGTQKCEGGTWGTCEGERTPDNKESCGDGKDNDCDGSTDNGCTCDYMGKSNGVCAGLMTNASGDCPQPSGYEKPTDAEAQCDGKDNDCDGATDESCICDYKGKSTGVCQGGTTRDKNGACPKPPDYEKPTNQENCDGKDNDCDGDTDEGDCECTPGMKKTCYSGPSGTAGTGICEAGELTCENDGSWSSCDGEVQPKSSEDCNNKDDDCDGVTDEGCPCDYKGHSTGVCTTATRGSNGNCMKPSGWMSMTSDEGPLCDGKDNDCDGNTDEGVTRSCGTGSGACSSCAGVCSNSSESCSKGSWSCQTPSLYESSESTCDNRDNDCDGNTDEGLSRNCGNGSGACSSCDGVCSNATETCSGGGWSCQAPSNYESSESSCDNKDNDCDGNTDEGVTRNCGMGSGACSNCKGVCSNASESCSSGGWSCQTPSDYDSTDDESSVSGNCDGKDNDCDGDTDEGCGCTYDPTESNDIDTDNSHDTGVCTGQSIDGSSGNCSQPGGFNDPETDCTDGSDNDCDGKTDEATKGGGASCSNDCECYSGRCDNNNCAHRIFVTSSKWDGKLGGLGGADSKCNSAAQGAGLSGNWGAILSDSSTTAKSRTTVNGPVYNLNGDKIADDSTDLWDGNIDSDVAYDESGTDISGSGSMDDWAWTGSDSGGGTRSSKVCSNWTSDANGPNGALGDSGDSGSEWLEETYSNGDDNCDQSHRLYCIDGQ